jgi:hypothetical protein
MCRLEPKTAVLQECLGLSMDTILNVNGRQHRISLDPRVTLLDALMGPRRFRGPLLRPGA